MTKNFKREEYITTVYGYGCQLFVVYNSTAACKLDVHSVLVQDGDRCLTWSNQYDLHGVDFDEAVTKAVTDHVKHYKQGDDLPIPNCVIRKRG